jgi:hypothetical protein
VQPEILQRGGGKAGGVALLTDENDALVVIGHACHPMRAGRVEPPFEHVAVDDDRARKLTVALAQFDGPNVHDEGTRCHFGCEPVRFDANEPCPRVVQERIDGSTTHR